MPTLDFVYVTYIATTPEKLWQALTDPAFTQQYWGGRRVLSDWQEGSTVEFRKQDGSLDYSRGKVLTSRPPFELTMAWITRTPGGDAPATKLTYSIQQAGPENVKFTLTHEPLDEGSQVIDAVRQGWPAILSSLKTLLETGQTLDIAKRWAAEGK